MLNSYSRKKILDIRQLKIIIIGIIIGFFLYKVLKIKNEIIFLFITGFSFVLVIAKLKLIDTLSYTYYSSISKESETLMAIILFCLNLRFYKIYIWSNFIFNYINTIILLFIIWKNLFIYKKIKTEHKKMFSFRRKELEQLKKIVNDSSISTILIDDNIGNGKTFLLEAFLEEKKDELEVIYLKLPLIKNIDILSEIVFNEIFKILKKNTIYLDKSNFFFKNLETIKFGVLEFKNNTNTTKTNWDFMIDLKQGINTLEEKKQLLIVLDDIEREQNNKKIKESICFLGELSEYLRNTKTTFLFLAQNSTIEKMRIPHEFDFFEKYYNKKMKLYFPNFLELERVDLEILVDEILENNEDKINNKNIIESHIDLIFYLLRTLENISFFPNIDFKNKNFRCLKKYIAHFKEFILHEPLEKNYTLILNYIHIAIDTFYKEKYKIKHINIYEILITNLTFIQNTNDKYFDMIEAQKYLEIMINKFERNVNRDINDFLYIKDIVDYLLKKNNFTKDYFENKVNYIDMNYLFKIINATNINDFLELNLKFENSISEILIKQVIKENCIKNISEINMGIFLEYLDKEIRNNDFYKLFYTGTIHQTANENNNFKIDMDKEQNILKINILKTLKYELIQIEKEIIDKKILKKILKEIDRHKYNPSICSYHFEI